MKIFSPCAGDYFTGAQRGAAVARPLMPQKMNTFCLGMGMQAGLDGRTPQAIRQKRQGRSKAQQNALHEPQQLL